MQVDKSSFDISVLAILTEVYPENCFGWTVFQSVAFITINSHIYTSIKFKSETII